VPSGSDVLPGVAELDGLVAELDVLVAEAVALGAALSFWAPQAAPS
jgi:hypothetical protein